MCKPLPPAVRRATTTPRLAAARATDSGVSPSARALFTSAQAEAAQVDFESKV